MLVPAAFGILMAHSTEQHLRTDFLQRRIIREKGQSLEEALREVEARRREAEVASRTDPLTALFNRRHFFSIARGPGASPVLMSLIILDVNHFKSVNDDYGHAVGDQVLQVIAQRIRANVRPGDVPCRYGGEEFAILLPEADIREAAVVGERLRHCIASESVTTENGPLWISVSVGIAANSEERRRSTSWSTAPTRRCTGPSTAAGTTCRSGVPSPCWRRSEPRTPPDRSQSSQTRRPPRNMVRNPSSLTLRTGPW